jgi:hypothetical protein
MSLQEGVSVNKPPGVYPIGITERIVPEYLVKPLVLEVLFIVFFV